jgi:hypothetical protein
MTLELFLGIVLAVALGIALAPAMRVVLRVTVGLALGFLWLVVIFGGFVGGIVMLFAGQYFWPDTVRAAGVWWLIVPLGLIGISAGAFKFTEWLNRPGRYCDVCGRPKQHTNLVERYGEWLCSLCSAQAERDDRLDGLLRRATSTVEDLYRRNEEWPNDAEVAELESGLRALGADAFEPWQTWLRTVEGIEKTGEWSRADNVQKRETAKRSLLSGVASARQRRHVSKA